MKEKVAISFTIILVLIYAFQNNYPSFMYYFSNIFPIIISGMVFSISLLSLKKYYSSFGSIFSKIWTAISIGLGLWFLGELTWGIYTIIFSWEVPYPSIADLFWISGYIPMILGFLLYAETFAKILPKTRRIGILTMASIYIISIISTLMPILKNNLLELILSLIYPILDVFLIYSTMLGIAIFFKGKIWKSWIMLCLGFICYAMADILFSYTIALGIYRPGNPLELFFHIGYILLILAILEHKKEL
ncbi:MAG: hypothetical protein NZ922_03380 [Candidatus Methanomethyliaceae archaeon]|nr:hypothetical protein [Candidatus Methanomethyliaceae archaeon]MDW7970521.1 hypothetical protein [Nitrososphaerota archaeon]